jgi:hypothetical protein
MPCESEHDARYGNLEHRASAWDVSRAQDSVQTE